MGLDQSEVLTVGSLVPKEERHTLPHPLSMPPMRFGGSRLGPNYQECVVTGWTKGCLKSSIL